jgi:dynein heavy chain
MIVGPTGSGKSKCYRTLQHALTNLRKKTHEDQRYQRVEVHFLNPKSISMGELYGEINEYTQEW